jgi:hypothetical protein
MEQTTYTGEINIMQETQKIISYNKAALTEKINKLNKKAAKLSCPEIKLSFGPDTVKRWKDEMGCRRVQVSCEATIDYEIPVIDGWKLISTFDIYAANLNKDKTDTENTEWVEVVTTSTVPGETVPTTYLNKNEIHCDHCGHKRNRNHSMLMQNVDTGEYKEVGSTCVKDFFGHDPVAFLRWAAFDFSDICAGFRDEDDYYGGGNTFFEDLKGTLVFTNAVIKEYGWMSKGRAYQQGTEWNTADEVARHMNPRTVFDKNEKRVVPDAADEKIADETIEYFANLSEADRANDYMANCYKMTVMGYVPGKHHGLTVSMVPTYNRIAAEKKMAENDTSGFVGKIGDKLADIEAEVVFTNIYSNDWGTKTLYIFAGKDGNTYKTFYTGNAWEAEKGDIVKVSGKVKAHDEYKGKKSTLLNFVKVTILTAPNGRDSIEAVEKLHDTNDNDELLNAFAA